MRKSMIVSLIAAASLLCGAQQASAQASGQTWPSRPVTMVVPFTAGTTSDVVARALVDHLSKAIGQPVVIDNRGGAGGNLGAGAAAKANPDGYTILLATTGPAATNKLMYKDMSFDPQRDFASIVLVGKAPVIIVGKPGGPKTLAELVSFAKANPDKVNGGFPGNGTLGHITGKLMQERGQIKIGETQYRGSAGIITDLLGGHIDVGIDSMAAYVSNVQEGKLNGLAIASAKRFAGLPNVPTASEAGLPGFEASVWYAMLAPTGTPPDVIAKLNAATNAFLKTPQAKEMFEKLGIEIAGGTPDELKAFTAAEIAKWSPIIKGANISF
jgi:tripartite-type tricarboxylate transporter receptor subunit TctC